MPELPMTMSPCSVCSCVRVRPAVVKVRVDSHRNTLSRARRVRQCRLPGRLRGPAVLLGETQCNTAGNSPMAHGETGRSETLEGAAALLQPTLFVLR